jgi:hypothetical protein
MAKITTKRNPIMSGLMGVAQGPRGYDLKVDGEVVGNIAAKNKEMWSRDYTGWIVTLYKTGKVEKRLVICPKGNKDGWALGDEGLALAKETAIKLLKSFYN